MTTIGELRHLMTIRAPAGVYPASDAAAVDVATNVPMKIHPMPANEVLAIGGLQSRTAYVVTARYREDIEPSYVLVEQSGLQRTFQILSVVPADRSNWIDLTCVAAG